MFHRPFFHFERQSRLFEKGDLKYVILNLLKDKPSHGYEIIRALEEHFHGFYTPSAGSVYPTLQMLNDMGYVSSSEQDGKKTYTITGEGKKFLEEQQDVIDKIEAQMKEWWEPRDIDDFHDTVHDLKKIGRMVGHQTHQLGADKWSKIKEVVSRACRDIEDILEK
ncbi:MAG: helix-turn-helix transcriptional regulator [Dehalococcoidales bacterium]|nr:helix-turn-helix transcriptional regulator [Dehalococcoidales bacterium]